MNPDVIRLKVMPDDQPNPFAAGNAAPAPNPSRQPVRGSRFVVSLIFICAGFVVGVVGLALVSNQYGNTDIYGLPVVGLGGMLLFTGLSSRFLKLRYSVIFGIIAAPASVVLLFVLYWVSIIAAAIMNS